MFDKLCEPEHMAIIIIVLLVALLVVGVGKGGGKLLLQLLKKVFGHEEININLGGGDMAGNPPKVECTACGLMVDPSRCPLHADEHGRSLRNEKDIALLKEDLKESRTRLWEKLDSMEGTLTEIKVAVAGLCVESKFQHGLHEPSRPRGGR